MQHPSVTEFDKVYTQFEEKPAVHLPRKHRTLGTAFIGSVQSTGLHTILGKPRYVLISLRKHAFAFSHIVILHTIPGKTAIH